MLGAIDHGVVMGCAARKSQKPALEIGGWAGGAQVPCFCLQVCADMGEVRRREAGNDDATWLPHSGCTPVALPCFLVTHKTRPAAINIARAM